MSRTVKVKDKVLSVRSLTRKEIKSLKKKGFDIGDLRRDQVDDLLDEVFPMVLSRKEIELIENSPYKVCTLVWTAIVKETFGTKDEEKNLPKSGAGSQTKKE